MIRRTRRSRLHPSLCLALAAVAAGCGDAPSEPAATTGSASTSTPATATPEVRSAEHGARDAAAEPVPTEPDGSPIAPEPQGTEPDKGSPGAQEATGGKIDVPIRDRRFTARTIDVAVGQIVVFTNDDDVAHTIRASDGGLPRSGIVEVGGRFEHTPLEPERLRYRCVIHPRMRGTLVVRA